MPPASAGAPPAKTSCQSSGPSHRTSACPGAGCSIQTGSAVSSSNRSSGASARSPRPGIATGRPSAPPCPAVASSQPGSSARTGGSSRSRRSLASATRPAASSRAGAACAVALTSSSTTCCSVLARTPRHGSRARSAGNSSSRSEVRPLSAWCSRCTSPSSRTRSLRPGKWKTEAWCALAIQGAACGPSRKITSCGPCTCQSRWPSPSGRAPSPCSCQCSAPLAGSSRRRSRPWISRSWTAPCPAPALRPAARGGAVWDPSSRPCSTAAAAAAAAITRALATALRSSIAPYTP
ncbi:MAG: hypothetical protein KatS3mg102_1611 [Planctomycetota bacterium]|nr:MAG: hypothetical protein KatS3mg102_1611 [Planctomycetota bacterium]